MEVNETFCRGVLYSKMYIRNEDNLEDQIKCSGYLYSWATNEPVESVMLAVIYIIGNCFAFIGNVFVVYAASKYGTFKMDKVTVMFVQNLAIADMIFILLYPAPMSVTHIARQWVFGAVLCKVISYTVTIPGTANIYFILAVSLHRFVRCKWPTRAHFITERRATIIVGITWIASFSFIAYLFLLSVNVDFVAEFANCSWHFQSSYKRYHMALMLITCALPIVITTALNVGLWIFVHMYTLKTRSKKKADKTSGLLLTSSITALFLLTWTPTIIDFIVQSYPNTDPKKANYIPDWAVKLRIIYVFGTWGNPVIYTVINKRFRDFVSGRLRRALAFFTFQKILQGTTLVNSINNTTGGAPSPYQNKSSAFTTPRTPRVNPKAEISTDSPVTIHMTSPS